MSVLPLEFRGGQVAVSLADLLQQGPSCQVAGTWLLPLKELSGIRSFMGWSLRELRLIRNEQFVIRQADQVHGRCGETVIENCSRRAFFRANFRRAPIAV